MKADRTSFASALGGLLLLFPALAPAAGIHHFALSPIPSPQFVNQAFGVTLTAQDVSNNVVSNFNGTANLNAFGGGTDTGMILGNLVYSSSANFGSATLGYSFRPNTNLIVTHVRSYSGTKISIWTDAGVLLASQNVTSIPATWVETPLAAPLQLNAGSTYRVAVYTAGKTYYWRSDGANNFTNGVIVQSFETSGDAFPITPDSARWWLVDLRYAVEDSVVLPVAPAVSGAFSNGVWTGGITVQQPATNVVLRVDDGNGHAGVSSLFDVKTTNDLGISMVSSSSPAFVGTNLTYTLTVSNTGAALATAVTVTDTLPANVSLVSAASSQGTCSTNGSLVTGNLGVVPGGTTATMTIVVVPTVSGAALTNSATVSRGESDGYLGNNLTTLTTPVTLPAISIADASVTEGNVGTTNLLFNVTLSVPSAQTVTVAYNAINGTAVAGVDFLGTTGVVTFAAGVTNQTIAVTVIGNVQVEPDKTVLVYLWNQVNSTLRRGEATGTILNDDGFPGQLDHFVWSTIPSPQAPNGPISATVTALDYFNHVVTSLNGPANLSATGGARGSGVIFGDLYPSQIYSNGLMTYGYSFTPNTNLTVTHVRTYSGTSKVSIWTDAGVLLASQNVSNNAGSWVETPLATPLALNAGTTYRFGGYWPGTPWYLQTDPVTNFAFGPINGGFYATGDTFPTNSDFVTLFVDLRFAVGAVAPLPVSLPNPGSFSNGIWSGNIAVQAPAANAVLRADDGNGHSGASNPFDVVTTNDLSIDLAASPSPAFTGTNLTYTLTVSNSGPTAATGVTVANPVPANTSFVSAASSQGTCSQSNGNVTCNLGVVLGGATATVAIVVVPTNLATTLTDFATVSRNEPDGYAGNNVASITTPVTTPVVNIADASCLEGNIGMTNLIFTLSLTTPVVQPVTILFATADVSAVAGTDYVSTNGVVTFPPGATNQTIAVGVIGNTLVESNKTFTLTTYEPTNAEQGRGVAVGTIINDDGLPGQVHHFVWNPVASPQYANGPFNVTVAAMDYSNSLVTNFNGLANLSAAGGGTTNTGTILGNPTFVGAGDNGTFTIGYSFTPNTNLIATHVRSFSGTKISIWTDTGVLLGSQSFSNVSVLGNWVETPLDSPVPLIAGSTYRVGLYTAGAAYAERLDGTNTFAYGIINQSYEHGGDAFPTAADNARWWFVDLRYLVGDADSLQSAPLVTGAFNKGVWTGNITVRTPVVIASLRADDANGHSGTSSGFGIITAAPPVIRAQPVSQDAVGGTNVTFTVSATGTPPLTYLWQENNSPLPGATNPSFTLTNVVRSSSGSYNVVITNFGGGTNSSNATLTVHVPQFLGRPLLLPNGTLTITSADLGGGTITAGDLAGLTAQTSTNLTNWVDLPGALMLTNGTLQLHGPRSANAPVRFYRIIENW